MLILFFVAAIIAVISTFMVISRLNAIHALLYLITSLLSTAVIFYLLGAPFLAALEVIIYAGAIMVLFIFVLMLLNLGSKSIEQESRWLKPKIWIGPAILSGVLALEIIYVLSGTRAIPAKAVEVGVKAISGGLFGPYMIAVELASFLLMAGLVGAWHIGRRWKDDKR
jgi:NADH-quinone oxidoreductase subunit J